MTPALPSTFAPTIQYIHLLLDHLGTVIYVGEQYQKQTLRNRTYFLTPQGATPFTVPVARYGYPSPPTSQILLSEHDHWRHRLAEALRSAYSATPYWLFYEDELLRLCDSGIGGRLCDWNREWLHFLLDEWQIPYPIELEDLRETDAYDFRPEVALPEGSWRDESQPRYWQVFEQETGFVSHLSALDLLLHMGPEGRLYLLSL